MSRQEVTSPNGKDILGVHSVNAMVSEQHVVLPCCIQRAEIVKFWSSDRDFAVAVDAFGSQS